MRRVQVTSRKNWRQRCDEVGFTFYDLESEKGEPYWRESAAYEVTLPEVEQLERETKVLFDLCMDVVEHVVRQRRFAEFAIPEEFWDEVTRSWDEDDPTVYGRFDLAWQPGGAPSKLLEFNADTPTSLVETAAAQWWWMRDVLGESADQFNSLHEQLIEQWRHLRTQRWRLPEGAPLALASLQSTDDGQFIAEDHDTVCYMAETAKAAGFSPQVMFIEDIQWRDDMRQFVGADGRPLRHIFKLYPWEWMVREAYGAHILTAGKRTSWVEPIWKMLLSNKQLLVVAWELFPDHPNLLPTYNSPEKLVGVRYVSKPKLSREGANVQVYDEAGVVIEQQPGDYGEEGLVYQAYQPLPKFDGYRAIIGSWVVGETPAGIDFRETSTRITGDLAFFVPHYIATSKK
jgi:glutathionylspermidine synthase